MLAVRIRLDQLLTDALARSRAEAQALIHAGAVDLEGDRHLKPGQLVAADASVSVVVKPKWASRAGVKLEHALDAFGIDPAGWLRSRRRRLHRQLHRRPARSRRAGGLCRRRRACAARPAPSRRPARREHGAYEPSRPPRPARADRPRHARPELHQPRARAAGGSLALDRCRAGRCPVKPQFEAGKGDVPRGGVVTDPAIWDRVLARSARRPRRSGSIAHRAIRSPITGSDGNVEFLVDMRRAAGDRGSFAGSRRRRRRERLTRCVYTYILAFEPTGRTTGRITITGIDATGLGTDR